MRTIPVLDTESQNPSRVTSTLTILLLTTSYYHTNMRHRVLDELGVRRKLQFIHPACRVREGRGEEFRTVISIPIANAAKQLGRVYR